MSPEMEAALREWGAKPGDPLWTMFAESQPLSAMQVQNLSNLLTAAVVGAAERTLRSMATEVHSLRTALSVVAVTLSLAVALLAWTIFHAS